MNKVRKKWMEFGRMKIIRNEIWENVESWSMYVVICKIN